ncbi:MAG: hypothetical protein FLDDKLPJ_01552 [Phycisphaerae bacterium]|nr:hypothetical protein [Phycisphaerae bacterium]
MVHSQVARDRRSHGADIWFDDDPRIGREAREEAARFNEILICPVATDAKGQASIEATIKLDYANGTGKVSR